MEKFGMEKFEKIQNSDEKNIKKRHLEQYSMEKHLASWKSFFIFGQKNL